MTKGTTPVPFLLRWWPIIAFLAAWLSIGVAAFYSVQTAQSLTQVRVTAVELAVNNHEERQRTERAELLAELRELRQDVKTLLSRPAGK